MEITHSPQFEKDWALCVQEGRDMSIPDGVIERFAAEDKSVEEEFENHPCSSFMKEYNYLFLQRDWIMTYKITDVVFLNRIGPLSIAP